MQFGNSQNFYFDKSNWFIGPNNQIREIRVVIVVRKFYGICGGYYDGNRLTFITKFLTTQSFSILVNQP